MADEIIKVLDYILNNDTLRTIGTAYFAYVAIVAVLGIVVFVIAFKHIMDTRKRFRKW